MPAKLIDGFEQRGVRESSIVMRTSEHNCGWCLELGRKLTGFGFMLWLSCEMIYGSACLKWTFLFKELSLVCAVVACMPLWLGRRCATADTIVIAVQSLDNGLVMTWSFVQLCWYDG